LDNLRKIQKKMTTLDEITLQISGNSGAAIMGKDIETIELSSSPKTLIVAAPNANVRSRSPSPTKVTTLESLLNMRQLENDMLKQRLEFAEKQIRERDIQIDHYKSLVQTLQALLSNNNMLNVNMGINMTVNSVPTQSPSTNSPPTTRNPNQQQPTDQSQNHNNNKGNQRNHHGRHIQKHQGRELSQSFSSLPSPSAPIGSQPSTNGENKKSHPTLQRIGKERKCVSFHEDVTVHYFEGKDKKVGGN
jgi:hypothetical protein